MDLRYSEEYEAFRREVRDFLAANWPPGDSEKQLSPKEQTRRFRSKAIAAGYLARHVPEKYGGSGQMIAKIALDLVGDVALREPGAADPLLAPDDPSAWVARYMASLGAAIAGGTANIQRNLIAERGLGLPRDAAASREKPR